MLSILATILIALGLFFFFAGTLGILRFPDFYTRMHAAGKCDSLAAVLITLGVAVYHLGVNGPAGLLVSLKIMLIAVFVFVASPTATHAITEAALIRGVEIWTKPEKRR